MPRSIYILYRFTFDLIAVISRLINATFFNGSTHQTLSARSYVESYTSEKWAKRRQFINGLFPWQEDHCHEQWIYDVEQAISTLKRNEALK